MLLICLKFNFILVRFCVVVLVNMFLLLKEEVFMCICLILFEFVELMDVLIVVLEYVLIWNFLLEKFFESICWLLKFVVLVILFSSFNNFWILFWSVLWFFKVCLFWVVWMVLVLMVFKILICLFIVLLVVWIILIVLLVLWIVWFKFVFWFFKLLVIVILLELLVVLLILSFEFNFLSEFERFLLFWIFIVWEVKVVILVFILKFMFVFFV